MDNLTQSRLTALLHYDPSTGVFRWLTSKGGGVSRVLAGTIAGHQSKCSGYITIGIDGKNYYAHRLAWLYVHGYWPPIAIDHINSNRADNRIANLRQASTRENNYNNRISKRNSSGFKGVYWNKKDGKWQAWFSIAGKTKYIGQYSSIEEAVAARRAVVVPLVGEFYRD